MLQESIINEWRKQLSEPSGSLTTNEAMPSELIDKLLDEGLSLKEKIIFEEVSFPLLGNNLDSVVGLNIIAGVQSKNRKGYLTLFRAIRFPTYKRIHEVAKTYGYAFSNYEQDRILAFYNHRDYQKKRGEIIKDHRFWTQPQERVVSGLPLFSLVNDALQIHYSFRGKTDFILLVAIHIPQGLLQSGKIKLISNSAIDLDYKNEEREWEIKDFIEKESSYSIDYKALRARGIDLHEIYSKDLPHNLEEAQKIGIEQEFCLLQTYHLNSELDRVIDDTKILKENDWFLHGIFGDQNVFARRRAKHLPLKCYNILTKT